MAAFVIDIETNGLLDDATQIWCIYLRSVGAKLPLNHVMGITPFKLTQNQCIEWLNKNLTKNDELIGHNLINYDLPLLKRLLSWEFKGQVIDTLVLSRLNNPDRIGGHSLEAWAKRLGNKCPPKVMYDDWMVYNDLILERCKTDVFINELVYEGLCNELASEVMKFDDLPKYIRMELKFCKLMQEQAECGVSLDTKVCKQHIAALSEQLKTFDDHLTQVMPRKMKKLPNLTSKNGIAKWVSSGQPYAYCSNGHLKRWTEELANPASPEQLREYLLSLGWKPNDSFEDWNYKQIKNQYGKMEKLKGADGQYIRTTPKLPTDESELERLAELSPDFAVISQRVVAAHRRSALQGYLENVRVDGTIPMVINSIGTNTHRVTHSVIANVPRVSSFYGKQLREVFVAPPGNVMVGCDASGLEARILAHYLNDEIFTRLIIEGDIHQYFYDSFLHKFCLNRSLGKNITYAFLYGAGDYKLGTMADKAAGAPAAIGKKIKRDYNQFIPNLEILTNSLVCRYEKYRGIVGIDGRFIQCRKKSALLNTLCQSAGAIAMKMARCKADAEIADSAILKEVKGVIFYHDESQYICSAENAEKVGQLYIRAIKWAGEQLNLRCPLTGEFKVGKSWADTH